MKVLVTGATGFLGSNLTKDLLEGGYQVKVTYRAGSNLFSLKGMNVEKVKTDLENLAEVDKAVNGCQVIFHLASLYKFYPWWEKDVREIYRVNVEGTKNILEAALKHKVKRFIFTSSIAALKNEKSSVGRKSKISHYARSKRLAEEEVEKACQCGLSAIILNPAIIIGRKDYRPTPSGRIILKFLNKEYPFYFNANLAVADLNDVTKAHITAMFKGGPGQRYLLSNDKVYALGEFFKLMEEASGIKAPKIELPYFLVSWLTYLDELISLILGKKPFLPLEGVKFCKRASKEIDNQPAKKDLGYKPTPLRLSLRKAVYWYRIHGYVKNRNLGKVARNYSFYAYFLFLGIRFLQFLEKIGFSSAKDPWRKTAQSYLRTEHAKFVLACPRLQLPEAKNLRQEQNLIIDKLRHFIKSEPALCWKLNWTRFAAYPEKTEVVDVVKADFNKKGNLEKFDIYFDSSKQLKGLDLKSNNFLIKKICQIYNKTKDYGDKKRPLILKRKLYNFFKKKSKDFGFKSQKQAEIFIDKFLAATFISFKESQLRYQIPDFIKCKNAAYGFLNIILRKNKDLKELDLWFQCHHACNDGVPVQECLNRLKEIWPVSGKIKVSLEKYNQNSKPKLISTKDKKKGVYLATKFISFVGFLKRVKKINRNSQAVKLTPFRFFIWKLGNHPTFKGKKFIIPIDLQSDFQGQRSLGFSVIKPSAFFDSKTQDQGLAKFQKEFDCQISLALKRCSEIAELFRIFSLLPPFFYAFIAKFMQPALKEITADLGISIIDKADLFVAPYSDIQTDGFIALSNFFTAADDRKKVCYLSCKGPYQKVNKYLDAIGEVAKLGGADIA